MKSDSAAYLLLLELEADGQGSMGEPRASQSWGRPVNGLAFHLSLSLYGSDRAVTECRSLSSIECLSEISDVIGKLLGNEDMGKIPGKQD